MHRPPIIAWIGAVLLAGCVLALILALLGHEVGSTVPASERWPTPNFIWL